MTDLLARLGEEAGLFVPLAPQDLTELIKRHELRAFYLDALSYMHDLVCPYWDQPDHARFDVEDAIIDLRRIGQQHFGGERRLDRHVQENAESAVFLGRQGGVILNEGSARDIEELRREAMSFMKGLLFTHNEVRAV